MVVKVPRFCVELAQSQDGVLSRRQALEGGMTSDAIDRRLRYGRWQSLQRGVYSVHTGEPTSNAVRWAAVLRAGHGAALSHQTAAELFRLVDRRQPVIHLTIPESRRVENLPGVLVHRSRRLAEAVHPSLSPPRTRLEETVLDLVDEAATFDAAFNIVCAACQRGLTQAHRVVVAMGKRAKLRWRRELTRALREVEAGVHSFLEYRYLHRVERPHALPSASRQVRIGDGARNRYLDILYDDFSLCVELDGQQAHPEEQRWADLHRINAITAQGITTLRYGWIDVERWPCKTAAQMVDVLRSLGWPGPARACESTCPVANQVPGGTRSATR